MSRLRESVRAVLTHWVTFTVASAVISELTGSPPITFLVATISALSSRTSRGTSWSCSSQANPEGATVGKASLPVEVVALVREAANGAPVIRALSSSWTWAGVRTPANDPVTRPAAGGMAVAFQRQGGCCARTTGTLRGLPRAAGASVEGLDPDQTGRHITAGPDRLPSRLRAAHRPPPGPGL